MSIPKPSLGRYFNAELAKRQNQLLSIHAMEAVGARGRTAVYVTANTNEGTQGRAIASCSGDVRATAETINRALNPRLARLGIDIQDLPAIDTVIEEMGLDSGTSFAVSMACAKAGANSFSIPAFQFLNASPQIIPAPIFGLINLDQQQTVTLIPMGAKNFTTAYNKCVRVYHQTKKILTEQGQDFFLGLRGGLLPELETSNEVFDLVTRAVTESGLEPGRDMAVAVDSSFATEVIALEKAPTVSQALLAVEATRHQDKPVVISSQKIEAEESFPADFAVGAEADAILIGSSGAENVMVCNRLLQIDQAQGIEAIMSQRFVEEIA